MKLLLLIASHCLCDYPLQGDFLARGKNAFAPLPGVPWYQCLFAHSMIHAGAVTLITGKWYLGLLEFVFHFAIDHLKCRGDFGPGVRGFNFDQILHVVCKVLWWLC